jgi:hypothetical protein
VRACTSSNSRTFSIAITAWAAEGLQQLDVALGERPQLRSADTYCSGRNPLAQQWRGEYRSEAETLCQPPADRELVLPLCRHVVDVDRPLVNDCATHCRSAVERGRVAGFVRRNRPVVRDKRENVAVNATYDGVVRVAHARGSFSHRIQHPLEICG